MFKKVKYLLGLLLAFGTCVVADDPREEFWVDFNRPNEPFSIETKVGEAKAYRWYVTQNGTNWNSSLGYEAELKYARDLDAIDGTVGITGTVSTNHIDFITGTNDFPTVVKDWVFQILLQSNGAQKVTLAEGKLNVKKSLRNQSGALTRTLNVDLNTYTFTGDGLYPNTIPQWKENQITNYATLTNGALLVGFKADQPSGFIGPSLSVTNSTNQVAVMVDASGNFGKTVYRDDTGIGYVGMSNGALRIGTGGTISTNQYGVTGESDPNAIYFDGTVAMQADLQMGSNAIVGAGTIYAFTNQVGMLTDTAGTFGVPSVDVNNRQLLNNTGTVVVDYSTNVVVYNTVNIQSNNLVNVRDLHLLPTDEEPSSTRGNLWYGEQDETLYAVGAGGSILQVGQENWIYGKNNTTGDMLNGTAVFISGSQGDRATFSYASTTNDDMHGVAVLTQDINSGDDGYATTFGLVRDLSIESITGGTDGIEIYLGSGHGEISTNPSLYHFGIVVDAQGASGNGTVFIDYQNRDLIPTLTLSNQYLSSYTELDTIATNMITVFSNDYAVRVASLEDYTNVFDGAGLTNVTAAYFTEVDGDVTNELIVSASMSGDELVIVEFNITNTVDMSQYLEASTLQSNQFLESEVDGDVTNEAIVSVALASDILSIVENNITNSVDLSEYNISANYVTNTSHLLSRWTQSATGNVRMNSYDLSNVDGIQAKSISDNLSNLFFDLEGGARGVYDASGVQVFDVATGFSFLVNAIDFAGETHTNILSGAPTDTAGLSSSWVSADAVVAGRLTTASNSLATDIIATRLSGDAASNALNTYIQSVTSTLDTSIGNVSNFYYAIYTNQLMSNDVIYLAATEALEVARSKVTTNFLAQNLPWLSSNQTFTGANIFHDGNGIFSGTLSATADVNMSSWDIVGASDIEADSITDALGFLSVDVLNHALHTTNAVKTVDFSNDAYVEFTKGISVGGEVATNLSWVNKSGDIMFGDLYINDEGAGPVFSRTIGITPTGSTPRIYLGVIQLGAQSNAFLFARDGQGNDGQITYREDKWNYEGGEITNVFYYGDGAGLTNLTATASAESRAHLGFNGGYASQTTTAVGVMSNYYTVLGMTELFAETLTTTPTSVIVDADGEYQINFSCSFSGGISEDYEFLVRSNWNGRTSIANRKMGTGGDVGTTAGSIDMYLLSGEAVSLEVVCHSDGEDIQVYNIAFEVEGQ